MVYSPGSSPGVAALRSAPTLAHSSDKLGYLQLVDAYGYMPMIVSYTLPQLFEKWLRFTVSLHPIHRDIECLDGFIWIGGYHEDVDATSCFLYLSTRYPIDKAITQVAIVIRHFLARRKSINHSPGGLPSECGSVCPWGHDTGGHDPGLTAFFMVSRTVCAKSCHMYPYETRQWSNFPSFFCWRLKIFSALT